MNKGSNYCFCWGTLMSNLFYWGLQLEFSELIFLHDRDLLIQACVDSWPSGRLAKWTFGRRWLDGCSFGTCPSTWVKKVSSYAIFSCWVQYLHQESVLFWVVKSRQILKFSWEKNFSSQWRVVFLVENVFTEFDNSLQGWEVLQKWLAIWVK